MTRLNEIKTTTQKSSQHLKKGVVKKTDNIRDVINGWRLCISSSPHYPLPRKHTSSSSSSDVVVVAVVVVIAVA
jgi:hypothetical protein